MASASLEQPTEAKAPTAHRERFHTCGRTPWTLGPIIVTDGCPSPKLREQLNFTFNNVTGLSARC